MEIIDEHDTGSSAEEEDSSSRAGQEPAHARVEMVCARHAPGSAAAAAPPSSSRCAQGHAAEQPWLSFFVGKRLFLDTLIKGWEHIVDIPDALNAHQSLRARPAGASAFTTTRGRTPS